MHPSFVTSADGTPIAFERSGDGPALVLVVGAFCDRKVAAGLASALAPSFTVHAYDRRGRGDSGDTAPYEVEREVEDLAALIDAAGGPVHVFGHSSGATLALRAASEGLPIVRLALYEPPLIADGGRPRPRDLAARVGGLVAAGHPGDGVALYFTEGLEMPAEAVAGMRSGPMWASLEAMAPTLVHDLTIVGDFSPPVARLAAVAMPTLVVAGGESPAWMRTAMRSLAAALPDARHLELAGQTHGAAEDVLAPVLTDHFRGPWVGTAVR